MSRNNKFDCKCTRDYSKFCQVLSEQGHLQYLSSCKSISMNGIALGHFNKLKLFIISMAQFHSNLSDENDQDASNNTTHICIIIHIFLQNK